MLKTRFTDLTGCKVPIQQAAIGGLARPQLATAVSDAGGLGMVYAGSFDPNQMTEVFEDMRRRTSGVFGANFLIPEAFVSDLDEIREQVETASKLVKVVEFFYRQPDPSLVDLVHKGGALASWQVGSNQEAVAAAEAGCDMIVAQGIEAGGHVRGKVSLLTLLTQVLDSVKVPVLAAGGIGSGRALAAVLAAGAFRHDQRDHWNHQGDAALGWRISERSEKRQASSSYHKGVGGRGGDTSPQMALKVNLVP